MEIRTEKSTRHPPVNFKDGSVSDASFVEALIDPVNVFDHPREVVEHPWFTHREKRTILLSWARDELVAEQVTSRLTPELRVRSRIDAVIEALSRFDAGAATEYRSAAAAIRNRCLTLERAREGARKEALL